jgi:hypothetical protein
MLARKNLVSGSAGWNFFGQIYYTSPAPVGEESFILSTEPQPMRIHRCMCIADINPRGICANVHMEPTLSADLIALDTKNQRTFWLNQPPLPIVIIDTRRELTPLPWDAPWLYVYFTRACPRIPRLVSHVSHTFRS